MYHGKSEPRFVGWVVSSGNRDGDEDGTWSIVASSVLFVDMTSFASQQAADKLFFAEIQVACPA